jgi:soluble lytic murein transglycosylase-like protein
MFIMPLMLSQFIFWCPIERIDNRLIEAIISVESNFDANAIGDKGKAVGLMQVHLTTAKDMGYKGTKKDLLRPENNIRYGKMYLNYLFERTGNIYVVLDAYNRGLSNVRKRPYRGSWVKHKYVGKIIKYLGRGCYGMGER